MANEIRFDSIECGAECCIDLVTKRREFSVDNEKYGIGAERVI